MNTAQHVLSRDGKELFRGTSNECYHRLQKTQSQSADWAFKYEGYAIKELGVKDER